jgi:hypothetical protein
MPPPSHRKGSLPESGRPRTREKGYRRGSPMKFCILRLLACAAILGLAGIAAAARAGLTLTCEAARVQACQVASVTAGLTERFDSIAPAQCARRPVGVTPSQSPGRYTYWPPSTYLGSPRAGIPPIKHRWISWSESFREGYSPRYRMERPVIRAGIAPAEGPRLLTMCCDRRAMPSSTPRQSSREPAAILRRQARPAAASEPIPPSSANEPGSGTA